jgi:hypothetical protein
MVSAGGDDGLRLLADEVVHDRQIVRRQIPHDADVMLEQPEIDPRRVEVVQRPERSVVDELLDLPNGPAEQERVIDHDAQVFSCRELDQFGRLRRVRRERLLDENVFAVLERRLRQVKVRPDGCDDGDGVDVRRPQHLRHVRREVKRRIGLLRALQRVGVGVADRDQRASVERVQVADDVRTPVPESNDTHPHRFCRRADARRWLRCHHG